MQPPSQTTSDLGLRAVAVRGSPLQTDRLAGSIVQRLDGPAIASERVTGPIRRCGTKISLRSATPCSREHDLLRGTGKEGVPEIQKISIVDDDESVREALKSLLKSAGFKAEAFASAEEFLNSGHLPGTDCLILDVRMPGMSGVELQDFLTASDEGVPIVFISAHADEEARARALESGAIDFLQKPFSDEALLSAIDAAIRLRAP
jgi:CheY-like chemotaxis protein